MQKPNIQLDLGNTQNKHIVVCEYTFCGEVIKRDIIIYDVSSLELDFIERYIESIDPAYSYELVQDDSLDFFKRVSVEVE